MLEANQLIAVSEVPKAMMPLPHPSHPTTSLAALSFSFVPLSLLLEALENGGTRPTFIFKYLKQFAIVTVLTLDAMSVGLEAYETFEGSVVTEALEKQVPASMGCTTVKCTKRTIEASVTA